MRLHKNHGPRRACEFTPCEDEHEYICPECRTNFVIPNDNAHYPFCRVTCVEEAAAKKTNLGQVARGWQKAWDREAEKAAEELEAAERLTKQEKK